MGKTSRAVKVSLGLVPAVVFTSLSVLSFTPAMATDNAGVGLSVKVIQPGTSPRPHIDTPITVPTNVPIANVSFVIQLSGLEPYSYVEIYAHSEPVLLASGFANGTGQFSATVNLPPTLSAGDHSVSVQNTLSNGTTVETTLVAFSVSPTGTVGQPSTPLADGTLSLTVPSNASATFAAPSLVNNVSVTVGALGQFAVDDQRIVSMPGWTLTGNVSTFTLATNSSVSMSSAQLGLTPLIVQASTTSAGVTVGNATIAGSATYPMQFARSSAGGGTGVTTLNADLLLKSPQSLPAGTYNAVFTLTLASN